MTLHLRSLKYDEIFALKENKNVLKDFYFPSLQNDVSFSYKLCIFKKWSKFSCNKGQHTKKHLSCIFQIWLYNAIISEEQNTRVWVNHLLNSLMGVWSVSVSEKQAIYGANTDASCRFQSIIINHAASVNDDHCTSFTQQHKQLDPIKNNCPFLIIFNDISYALTNSWIQTPKHQRKSLYVMSTLKHHCNESENIKEPGRIEHRICTSHHKPVLFPESVIK